MGTTRRYRATDKTKTAKPKKKVSRREALIKRVEKLTGGKVKHARDPLRFTAKEVKAIYELGRASGAKDLSTKQKNKKSPARPKLGEGSYRQGTRPDDPRGADYRKRYITTPNMIEKYSKAKPAKKKKGPR